MWGNNRIVLINSSQGWCERHWNLNISIKHFCWVIHYSSSIHLLVLLGLLVIAFFSSSFLTFPGSHNPNILYSHEWNQLFLVTSWTLTLHYLSPFLFRCYFWQLERNRICHLLWGYIQSTRHDILSHIGKWKPNHNLKLERRIFILSYLWSSSLFLPSFLSFKYHWTQACFWLVFLIACMHLFGSAKMNLN